MKKLNNLKIWHKAWVTVLLCCTMLCFNACGNDEPDEYTIDYMASVENEFQVNASSDNVGRYISPVTVIKEAIRKAYPNTNTQGNDEAVIAACDKAAQEYIEMYTGYEDHLSCTINLVRLSLDDNSINRQSVTLRTYAFDINPVIEE